MQIIKAVFKITIKTILIGNHTQEVVNDFNEDCDKFRRD
jgi:hypothetical protein